MLLCFGFSEQRAMVVTGDGVVLASVESYVANGRVGFGVVISRCDDHTCARSIRPRDGARPADT